MLPDKFETKVVAIQVFKAVQNHKSLFDKAELINCGDAGQEGELIQRWVMNEPIIKAKLYRFVLNH
jgi:DNA topoisomerase-3